MINKYFCFALAAILLIASVNALADPFDDTRKLRLEFGHSLEIEGLSSAPLSPGKPAMLNLTIQNRAEFYLKDVRISINLPASINFFNDISVRKLSSIESKEKKEFDFAIIASPTAAEGIYQGSITAEYLNHMGTERSENYTFSVIVKSKPTLFAKLEDSQFYKGKKLGDITITIINDGPANIKFLSAELVESPDYEIIGAKKQYIGDLDSDDFESVTFKLKMLSQKDEISFPLKIQFKDSMNQDYSESIALPLKMLSKEDLGIKSSNSSIIVLIIIVVVIIAFIIYRIRKKKHTHIAKDGFVIPVFNADSVGRKKKKR